ncbi:palmitoyl-protein thioesterase ABHD10, mitochondrial [Larus michahellis]|uniref:palmitoyl-protein thioesterase ABHD10, mitochondrial n=1 Tax=Larus michahellis TaxID=119627 RepID=UPI003D9B1A52
MAAVARSLRGLVRGGGGCRRASSMAMLLSPLRAVPGLPVCRLKSSVSFLTRPDRPNLAYHKLKGRNPGVIFLPGFNSNMNGRKAAALEDFCNSLGHAFIRFDYTGCGSSGGKFEECTIGKWRKDVLSILDELTDGPQILVGSSMGGWLMLHAAIARPDKVAALVGVAVAADHFVTAFKKLPIEAQKEIEEKGEWKFPTKHNEEGYYSVTYDFIREAENHCVLNSPIPVTCPIRLIHGMNDDDVSWQISMQVADRVLSKDVDVILRKTGRHRMSEKEDTKLLVNTVDDLIDKLATVA